MGVISAVTLLATVTLFAASRSERGLPESHWPLAPPPASDEAVKGLRQ